MSESWKDSWVRKPIPLKFCLGEITLFSVSVPALVLSVHFCELPKASAEPLPPFEAFPPGVEQVFIPSQPVDIELSRLSLLRQCIRYVPAQYRKYYVDVRGCFDDYLKKFSAKSRSSLLRTVRKFAEFSGEAICCREFRDPQEIMEFHRLAYPVAQKTYQKKLLHGGLPPSDQFWNVVDFTRCMARGYILFHREQPIAYLFGYGKDDWLTYCWGGYDPEFRNWSPGTILHYAALERLFAEQHFRLIDFGEGESFYKRHLATGSVPCADLYYFRRTARNLLLLGLHAGLFMLSASVVKFLDQLNLKARVKKFIRLAS